MSTDLTIHTPGQIIEAVIAKGDLAKLSPEERTRYYGEVCRSVGLNPLTKPFEYITLNGRLTLYARKDATDQLRSLRSVSVTIASREQVGDVYVVTARATTPDGRTDESIGAVAISSLKGDALANALMKAETKAKRRVTLSICGLGILDETEMETIPGALPATAGSITVEEQTASDEQIDALCRLFDHLNELGVKDEKIVIAVRNLSGRQDIYLDASELSLLPSSIVEKIYTKLDERRNKLMEEKAAKFEPPTGLDRSGHPIDDLENSSF